MKEGIRRIKDNSKTWEICFWWIFRALMIYAFVVGIVGFINGTNDYSDPLQVGLNLLLMFVWEIFQFFPKKSFPRYIPSYFQDVTTILIFCASFGGKFLNFYYELRLWDSGMHLISGGLGVILGYEICVAMMKRDRKTSSLPIILLCALGYSFFISTCWELFEFFADQVMCNSETGAIGDAQHWCYELAVGTPKLETLIDPKYAERWPIMDTMIDIVLNTIGAVVMWIVLKIYPYHHRKKYDVDTEVAELIAQKEEKELVTK